MADSLNITLAPQLVLTVTHDMGTAAAGFTIIAGISRSTGGGAGNEYLNSEKVKLAGIETAATADQTGPEIKALYEVEPSAFTDAQFTKLGAVEAGATADQSNAEIKTAYELNADTNAYDDAAVAKLAGIEALATADQSNAEIRTAVEAATDSNVFTDADHSKLNAIEAGATADQSNAEIKTAYELNANTNAYTDAAVSKLAGIEAGATADQSNSEIKTAYEANADTNAFLDAEKTKLTGIETGATADQSNGEIETAYNTQVAKISAGEITGGTEVAVRRFSPDDVEAMIQVHAPAGGMSDAEVKTAYENNADTNAFTDALEQHYGLPLANTTALTALTEASLFDKERRFVEGEISDFFYDATASSGDFAPDDQTGGTGWWLKVVASGETAASIKTKYESNADTNEFSDAEQTKLAGIDTAAKDDQTGAEIKAAYEVEANAFTDTKNTKLTGIETAATADQSNSEIETAYNTQVAQISGGEITAGTETAIRRYSPADIVAIIAAHESGGPAAVAVNEHVVDYTLALTDAGDIQEMNKATAIVLSIPLFATVAFPVGTIISVSMTGVGVTSITAVTGVTLNGVSAGSGDLAEQWDAVSLYNRAEDVWVVQGAIGAVT